MLARVAGAAKGRWSSSHVRVEGLEQAGAYRTGNGLAMAAMGVRGGLPSVGGFALAVKSDAFLVWTRWRCW